MDLAGLKRPRLQALCKRHGLPAVGTNAALVARLAGVLQPPEAAGAGDDARATKGCLKRPAAGKDLRETKKVSFVLEQSRRSRRQSLVFSSPPVAARSRGRSRAAVSPVAEADGRDRGQKHAKAAGPSTDDDSVATEVGVGAPLRRSRRISIGTAEVKAPEAGVGAPLRRSRRISIGTAEVKALEAGVATPPRQSRRNSVCMGDLKAAEVGVGASLRRSRRISICTGDVETAHECVGAPSRRTRRNSVCMGDFKAAEEGGDAPLRRSRRKSVCLGDIKVAESQEGVGIDKKRKRKSLGKEEEVAASGHMGVSCRVTRRSSLVGAAVLSPIALEKKQGKRKTAGYKNEFDATDQVAKAQDLVEAATVDSKKNGREAENCELVVQKYAKVGASIRITRSRSTTATVTEPNVVENENKRRRVTKDAPVTRTLRNRVVQVNSHVVQQPTVKDFARRSTRRSIVPAVLEEEDKYCAAQKNPVRRSKRKSVVPDKLDAEVAPTANCDGITITVATPQFEVGQTVAQEETIVEKSNDEHVAANPDLKINSNYEAIFAEKSTSLVAESFDDEQAIIQVQQDAVHGCTQEMLLLCSTEPECKQLCRSPVEAGPLSDGNERCSSHAEQSPLGVQSLFSQEKLDDSMEHGALVFATSHTLEKTTMSQSISQCDTQLDTVTDDCMHVSQQDNGQGLPEVSHEGKLVTSSLFGFSVDANHMKEVINSAKLASKVEGNKISHFEDLDASCEKTSVNLPVDSAFGISGTEFGCSLHAPDAANDYTRSGSNLAQLETADLLDELIGSSETEVQHPSQKEHCIEARQNQVASRPCTNDIVEATTAKCFESGVVLLPAEGSEKLKDSHLDSKIKSTQAVESGYCNKDISNTSDDGSVAVIVSERNSSGFTLPKDYPADCYLRCEPGMSGERKVSNPDTIGNPSFGSAMSEHNSASFEEVVHKMKNIVGTCPSSPKELLMELQSVSSKENIKESSMLESAKDIKLTPSCNENIRNILDNGSAETVVYEKFLFGDKSECRMNTMNNYAETCSSDPRELLMDLQTSSNEAIEDDPSNNLAFPSTERDESESTICHAANMAETVVPSDTDVFLGPSQDFSRDEAKQECMSVSLDDAEGSLKSNHLKDTSEGERIWTTIAEKILSEEKRERESMRSLNCDILDENSHSKRDGICQSGGWMRIDEIDSKLSSCDAEVRQQGHVEGCQKVNEYEVTPAGHETDMSESVPLKRIESEIMMDGEGEEYSFSRNANMGEIIYTGSAFPYKHLNTKLKDPETEKGNCVINKDAGNLLDTEMASKSKASNLSNDIQLDPSNSSEHNVSNVSQWDAPKSP